MLLQDCNLWNGLSLLFAALWRHPTYFVLFVQPGGSPNPNRCRGAGGDAVPRELCWGTSEMVWSRFRAAELLFRRTGARPGYLRGVRVQLFGTPSPPALALLPPPLWLTSVCLCGGGHAAPPSRSWEFAEMKMDASKLRRAAS